ncbi:LPS-assembly protein LptD [Pelovirga terrestris]|uniref:LPS-assembly protein LptD n=1 Tax=Pelovirga terrestris TaxID=2771352 RepID=A0A8J6QWD9_9BACT|nr:LPS assembly protein LptD [Pelovirga terrestris]MBD1399786.1 LPS-assembly protein LptD [Pelovirga terrestris]
MLIRHLILLLLIGLSSAPGVEARSRVVVMGEPVYLEADELSYDHEAELYQARGDVRLNQGELQVLSEQMSWSRATGEVEASGNVQFLSPTETLTGSTACYNLDAGTGRVDQGYFYLLEENLHVRGSTIEQLGEDDYRITSGTFTTCDGTVPDWKFGAGKIDVSLGGYARARHMVFYLKDIPTLYFPYMVYPAKTERESGWLIPSAGYSKKRGFSYGAAYYQVLGVNQDATFYLDYLSKMGIGKGLEYRYIFGRDNAGEARVYHIDVQEVDDVRVDEERYALEWIHSGTLPGRIRMVADALYVNDDEYFKDFGEVAGDYNRDQVQSTFSLSRNWRRANLVSILQYTKNLETDQRTTLQLLPRINFNIARTAIGNTALAYEWGSEYTHFWRREGMSGQRLMVRPVVSVNPRLFNLLSVNPSVAYRQRYYWDLDQESSTQQTGLFEVTTRVSTPPLQRTYDLPFGAVGRVRHAINPEVIYDYIPEKDQQHIPRFDSFDRIAPKNRIEYALVQRLRARLDDETGQRQYRDWLYLRLSLLQHLSKDQTAKGFGEARAQLTLLPVPQVRLATDVIVDSRTNELKELLVEGQVADRSENYLRVSYNIDRRTDLDYGEVNLGLGFLQPIYLTYQQRYDFFTNDRLEERIGIEYRRQCWSLLLTLRDRTDGEQSFMLTFSMLGLGSVGGFSGGLGGG